MAILIFMKNIIAVRLVLQDQLNLQPAKLPENWPRHMLLFARSEKYLLRLSNKNAIARGNAAEGTRGWKQKKRGGGEQDKNKEKKNIIKGKRKREKKNGREEGRYVKTRYSFNCCERNSVHGELLFVNNGRQITFRAVYLPRIVLL